MYRLGGGGDRYWLGDSPLTEGEQEGSTGWRCGDVLGEKSGEEGRRTERVGTAQR